MKKNRLDEICAKSIEESSVIALINSAQAKGELPNNGVLEILTAFIQECKTNRAHLVEITSEAFLSQSKNFADIKGQLSEINKKLDMVVEKMNAPAIYEAIEEYDLEDTPETPEINKENP